MARTVAAVLGIALGGISCWWLGRQSAQAQQSAQQQVGVGSVPGSVPAAVPAPNTVPRQTGPGTANGSGNGNGSVPAVPVKPTDFFKYGFPGPIHDLQGHQEFVSVYDRRTRNPYYVIEHLTPESLQKDPDSNGDRKNSFFREDEGIPTKFRALLQDYFRSGYDRGHQAPAADAKFSQKAMDETFYLTNISPQVGSGFNRDYWASFEYFCRKLTDKYNSVRVVTGPLFLPKRDPADGKVKVTYEVIGNPPNVAVPTHFFKLVIGEQSKVRGPADDNLAVAAFVLPNEQIPNEVPLTSFLVPLDALERSSGLEFLNRVPQTKQKELCKEVTCQIVVRDFSKAQKQLTAPRK